MFLEIKEVHAYFGLGRLGLVFYEGAEVPVLCAIASRLVHTVSTPNHSRLLGVHLSGLIRARKQHPALQQQMYSRTVHAHGFRRAWSGLLSLQLNASTSYNRVVTSTFHL